MKSAVTTCTMPPFPFNKVPFQWAVLPLVLLSWSASAQVAPPVQGAGELLRQIEPATLPAPAKVETPALRIELAPGAAPTAETDLSIDVTTIELRGNKSFDTATLKALVADAEGRAQTLAELNKVAQRITDFYIAQGQPLASAYLPEQSMDGGVLRIDIVEAVYGQIRTENRSQISTARIESFISSLKPGDVVLQEPLDRGLLLLRDLAGVSVTANVRPGAEPGTTDLVLTAVDAPRVSGTFTLDNQGSKATDRERGLGSAEFKNWLGQGETFNLLALTSGAGMAYVRVAGQAPVTGVGTTMGVGLARLQYKLGGAFASLEANGTATVIDGFIQQSLVRTAHAGLNAELRFEHKMLKDQVDSVGSRTFRTLTSMTPGLNGELRDEWGGGGRTNFSVTYTIGGVEFDNAIAEGKDQDLLGANTKGSFARMTVELARQQSLGAWPALAGTTLFARVRGQGANKNLDSSEQIGIAGPQGVRGYDANAASGAQGYVATLELRQVLGNTKYGLFQAQLFADSGQATVYRHPLVNSTLPNHTLMQSVGLGMSWATPTGWNAQLVVARPISSAPEIDAHRSTRTWLTLGGTF